MAAALALLTLPALAQTPAPKADAAAGKARVEAVCGACHGVNGVSVADNIPNLAGQRVAYLEAQLRALKVRRAQERGDESDRGAALEPTTSPMSPPTSAVCRQ